MTIRGESKKNYTYKLKAHEVKRNLNLAPQLHIPPRTLNSIRVGCKKSTFYDKKKKRKEKKKI